MNKVKGFFLSDKTLIATIVVIMVTCAIVFYYGTQIGELTVSIPVILPFFITLPAYLCYKKKYPVLTNTTSTALITWLVSTELDAAIWYFLSKDSLEPVLGTKFYILTILQILAFAFLCYVFVSHFTQRSKEKTEIFQLNTARGCAVVFALIKIATMVLEIMNYSMTNNILDIIGELNAIGIVTFVIIVDTNYDDYKRNILDKNKSK